MTTNMMMNMILQMYIREKDITTEKMVTTNTMIMHQGEIQMK